MNKKLLVLSLLSAPAIILFTSGTLNSYGQSGMTGSPGEYTCSVNGCHGAGSGGVANNTGPGSLVISTNPAFINNEYVPGTTYHVSVVVSESGRQLFGFSFEALDNSGSTNLNTDNTAGSIAITDATHTQKTMYNYFSGRTNVMHTKNGGFSQNAMSFNFDWVAPTSGTVNMYAVGLATDYNGTNSGGDNVYNKSFKLTANSGVGLSAIDVNNFSVQIFPNPVNDVLSLKLNLLSEKQLSVALYSLEGKLSKTLLNQKVPEGLINQSFSINDISQGVYLLKIVSADGEINHTQKIIVK